jgi:hypothetical protein
LWTAEREARETLAASRHRAAAVNQQTSVQPMVWAVGGGLLFFVGMIVSGRGRHLAWTIAETGAFSLVYPTVVCLVRLNAVPLSA